MPFPANPTNDQRYLHDDGSSWVYDAPQQAWVPSAMVVPQAFTPPLPLPNDTSNVAIQEGTVTLQTKPLDYDQANPAERMWVYRGGEWGPLLEVGTELGWAPTTPLTFPEVQAQIPPVLRNQMAILDDGNVARLDTINSKPTWTLYAPYTDTPVLPVLSTLPATAPKDAIARVAPDKYKSWNGTKWVDCGIPGVALATFEYNDPNTPLKTVGFVGDLTLSPNVTPTPPSGKFFAGWTCDGTVVGKFSQFILKEGGQTWTAIYKDPVDKYRPTRQKLFTDYKSLNSTMSNWDSLAENGYYASYPADGQGVGMTEQIDRLQRDTSDHTKGICWSITNTNGQPQNALVMDFGKIIDINQMTLMGAQGSLQGGWSPSYLNNMKIYYRNTVGVWTPMSFNPSTNTITAQTTGKLVFGTSPVNTQYVAITGTDGGNYVGLEILYFSLK